MTWKPDYVTLADAKDFLRIPATDTADDVIIGGWITAASRAVDNYCNRQFGLEAAPVSRVYRRTPAYDPSTGMWAFEIDDLMTTTGLTVNGVAYATSGATLGPDNAALDGVPWRRISVVTQPIPSTPGYASINTVFARFGWTTVPPAVPGATKLQISRWMSRRDSPQGIAGSPDAGGELRVLARLDPDVKTALTGLRRRRKVA